MTYKYIDTLYNIKVKNPEVINGVFQTSSKISDYNNQMQSASFLLFLCSFVGILFFISAGLMLHFKLLTEFEAEKIKYKKINKVGITNEEVSKTISRQLQVLFFVPIILSILIAITILIPTEAA